MMSKLYLTNIVKQTVFSASCGIMTQPSRVAEQMPIKDRSQLFGTEKSYSTILCVTNPGREVVLTVSAQPQGGNCSKVNGLTFIKAGVPNSYTIVTAVSVSRYVSTTQGSITTSKSYSTKNSVPEIKLIVLLIVTVQTPIKLKSLNQAIVKSDVATL